MSAEPTAADLARLLAGFHAHRFDRLRADDQRVWLERAEAVRENYTAAIAAAREEGRQEVRAAVEALADRMRRTSYRANQDGELVAAAVLQSWHFRLRAAVAPAQSAEGEW